MPYQVKYAVATCGSTFLILLGYNLILSNQTILSSLKEGNGFLYAFVSASRMMLFGTLIGVTWDFIDKLFSAEIVDPRRK